jgi:hypothetical protein
MKKIFFVCLALTCQFAFAQNDKIHPDSLLKQSSRDILKKLNIDFKLIAEPMEKENRFFYIENIKNELFENANAPVTDNLSETKPYQKNIPIGLYLQTLQDNVAEKFSWSIEHQFLQIDSLKRKKGEKGTFSIKTIFYLRGISKSSGKLINVKDSCFASFSFNQKDKKNSNVRLSAIYFKKIVEMNIEMEGEIWATKIKNALENFSRSPKNEQDKISQSLSMALSPQKTIFNIYNAENKTATYQNEEFWQRLAILKEAKNVLKSYKISYLHSLHKAEDDLYYYKKTTLSVGYAEKNTIEQNVEKVTDNKQKPQASLWRFDEININESKQ